MAVKRFTARLLEAPAVILIDNVTHPIEFRSGGVGADGDDVGRPHSRQSETVSLPVRCAFVMTANNPSMSTEISRRTIRIRIDSKSDRPWLRSGFHHEDLRAWVDEIVPDWSGQRSLSCRHGLQKEDHVLRANLWAHTSSGPPLSVESLGGGRDFLASSRTSMHFMRQPI